MRRLFVGLLINIAVIYVTLCVAWFIYLHISGTDTGPESWAFFLELDAPIETMSIVVSIYLLSLLDNSVLRPQFVIPTTIIAGIADIVSHIVFLADLGVVLTVFVVYTVIRRGLKTKPGSPSDVYQN
jgi:hypothetical protein